MIHQSSVIGQATIEQGVYIGALCFIGDFPEWKGREQDNKGVLIKKGTRITGLVTIDGGAEHQTIIGENCYIMKHAHLGHDCILEDNVTVSCGAKIGGHCKIGKGVTIGLNAVIHQRVEIPEGCMIGALAFIGKKTELKPFRKYAGVPAKDIGSNLPGIR
jgi:UDP-N-acetylglucosamine acyltransferase